MYRLVVYGLGSIAVISIMLASFGKLAMSPVSMIISLAILMLSVFSVEWLFAKIWRTPFNSESWLITALIIFLIFPAPKNVNEAIVTVLVGIISSTSKYLIAWNGKHIFNPAAFAVAIVGVLNLQITTWWVGSSLLLPFTLLLGLLVVLKIKRVSMVFTFVIVCIALFLHTFIDIGGNVFLSLQSVIVASPLIFLSTIMLTEPATMPAGKWQRIVFALLVAVLYAKSWKLGPIAIYPEVALLLGNVFAFAVSPKFKTRLRLKEIQKISDQVYNFVFIPDKKFAYTPGQYMEWTLPDVPFDGRGNRRSFTIASSPTEDVIQLGVKFYKPSSTYKYVLSRMQPGDSIYASQLSGNFTLGSNTNKKLVFIAGGIGVTPFRSMVKYITDMNIKSDIYLIYAVSKPDELAYANEFLAAKDSGITLIPIVTDMTQDAPGMRTSKIDSKLIESVVPDYTDRLFYISGPNAMVESTKAALRSMGVKRTHIKTDYFSGY